jgi:hypothetical protein
LQRWRRSWLALLRRWRKNTCVVLGLRSEAQSLALPAGGYLCFTYAKQREAIALVDAHHSHRRLAWLRRPGLNVSWL